jgi:hypothetical protein
MKGVAKSIAAGLLTLGLLGGVQSANAQYASSLQAKNLLEALQDTRSMTSVGISWLEYGKIARDLQVKLDRFLRAPGAEQYPAGWSLKNAAKVYIMANSSSARHWSPQPHWKLGSLLLKSAEECINANKKCISLAKAKDTAH